MGIPERPGHQNLLRQRAEQALQGKPVEVHDLSSEDIQYLLHELQVHQAELAIQNAELRQIQIELETSRDQFVNLYNFAPAGYCTIDRNDTILEANQTLANLLDRQPHKIKNHHLSEFIASEDQDKYFLYRRRAFERMKVYANEIRLVRSAGEQVFVRLESMLAKDDEDRLLIMLVDISEQRALQQRVIEQREKERQKIARDLHDGPVQALSAINFMLRSIIMDNPEYKDLSHSLEDIQASLREQIQILRNYSVELRPPILDQLGLEMGIRSYLEGFGEKHPQMQIKVAIHPVGNLLSEDASLALFRIFQEALNNISKHAFHTTSEVVVRLDRNEHQASLDIQDNGKGFELPEDWFRLAQQGHLGIIGMRERAEAVGGHLIIRSGAREGTSVRAVIPLQNLALK